MFCICCAACCQHVCHEDATSERASVCGIPKSNDRPLAKDLPESRLFTLETVGAWKHAIQSTIYHRCNPHREILHHRHEGCTSAKQDLGFVLGSKLMPTRTCRFAEKHKENICDVSVGGNLSVVFNHGRGLQAGGSRTLHYRPIPLRWILPPRCWRPGLPRNLYAIN